MQMLYEVAAPKETERAESESEKAETELEIVEFRMGGEWYGFESRHVREVYPLKEYCPLPCTPPFVLGLVNIRGQLLVVLDLTRLFGMKGQELAGEERASQKADSRNQVLILRHEVVGHETMEVGILVDKLLEVRHLRRQNLQAVTPALNGLRREFSLGISPKGVLLLDAEKLLTSRHIVVNEYVHEPVFENVYETLVTDL